MELIDLAVQEPSQSQNSDRRNERLPEDRTLSVPLLQAALKGDWKTANSFLKKHPEFVRVPIDREYATALHNAAASKHTNFVIKLLKLMNKEDLELKTTDGCTALFFAAQSGVVRIAMEMVKMNKDLLCIRAKQDVTPLLAAAMRGRRNMVSYLYSVTPFQEYLTSTVERLTLLLATVSTDMYDVALKILETDPDLAIAETAKYGRIILKTMNVDTRSTSFAHTVYGMIALGEMARKPFAIGKRSQLAIWERCLKYIWFKGFYKKALRRTLAHQLVEVLWEKVRMLSINQMSSNLVQHHMNLLIEAAKVGNIEFLNILIRSYPDLIWQVDEDGKTLLHIAILYRQENVFNLIYDIAATTNSIALSIDENNNNMLHLAGELAPSSRLKIVSGAALQMQRELLWFKEIEKIVPPAYVVKKNLHGQTPRDLFTMTHEGLLKDGEKWMKDTTSSCMLVATLIATVVFVAAFTGPGGKSLDSGTSIVLESTGFLVFFISNAIAFLSSSTSILVFLSILTSRYTENDFLRSLPMRLLLGLTALFISVVGMVVAFSATCSLIYSKEQTSRVPIVIASLTGVPIIFFVLLHYELWIDIMRSTYGSRFLFRSYKRRLFQLGEDDEWAIWQYQL
ncbi:hypothetical protein F2P56_007139 [Juglans regia]|uniref:PGG domain-containing protein n=1 Tax=Juglans regia TaxID=51240 RepID=A0A834D5P5_JUGRE|nr:hypothetical protein F2P56_007139 [Juglans regia]